MKRYTKTIALVITIVILSVTIRWMLKMNNKDYENSQPNARLYFLEGSRCIEGVFVTSRNDAIINVGGTPYLTQINYCPAVIAMMKEKM